MPIALCFVPPAEPFDSEQVARSWAAHAPFAEKEMTVLTTEWSSRGGKPYRVIAKLHLPSLWSADQVTILQQGLAASISEVCQLPLDAVFVMTETIESEQVVENGVTQRW